MRPYWPFVRGIHRSLVNSPHKGQWRGAFMFSLICASINGWVNNGEAGDLRRHRAHYDGIVMCLCPLVNTVETLYSTIYYNKYFIELHIDKSTQYVALSGELWSVFYEFFNRNWSCYKGFLLYDACILWQMGMCLVITKNMARHLAHTIFLWAWVFTLM